MIANLLSIVMGVGGILLLVGTLTRGWTIAAIGFGLLACVLLGLLVDMIVDGIRALYRGDRF